MNLEKSSLALEQIKQIETLLKESRKSILRSTRFTLKDLERELESCNQVQVELLLNPKDGKIAEKAFLIYHNTIKRLLEIIFEIKSAY